MLSGKQKAVAAFVISFIGAVVAWALATFPDNDDVQMWGAIIAGAVTVLANTYGVYKTRNRIPTISQA
jgi:hypothetical protein